MSISYVPEKSVVAGKFNSYRNTLSPLIVDQLDEIGSKPSSWIHTEGGKIYLGNPCRSWRGRIVYERPDGSFGKRRFPVMRSFAGRSEWRTRVYDLRRYDYRRLHGLASPDNILTRRRDKTATGLSLSGISSTPSVPTLGRRYHYSALKEA